jgi:hypothetical protein
MDKRLQDLLKKGEELEQNRKELADNLKTFVYTIGKFIDLRYMKISYELRYADITLKSEQREIKLNKILE